jgi:hypothetical protein
MKHYNRKNYGSHYKPYARNDEAAYGPRRNSHFRGPLRNTNGADFNRHQDRTNPQDRDRNRAASHKPEYGRGQNWGRHEEEDHGYYGPVQKRVSEDNPEMGARNDEFVIDRKGGKDRDKAKEELVLERVWATVGARVTREERLKKESEQKQGARGPYHDEYASDDSDAVYEDEDFDDKNLRHYRGVTREGLRFCLEKATEYWNHPDSYRYKIQCPCEWVRKEVSYGFVCFCFQSPMVSDEKTFNSSEC